VSDYVIVGYPCGYHEGYREWYREGTPSFGIVKVVRWHLDPGVHETIRED